jgi:hypothetical protein
MPIRGGLGRGLTHDPRASVPSYRPITTLSSWRRRLRSRSSSAMKASSRSSALVRRAEIRSTSFFSAQSPCRLTSAIWSFVREMLRGMAGFQAAGTEYPEKTLVVSITPQLAGSGARPGGGPQGRRETERPPADDQKAHQHRKLAYDPTTWSPLRGWPQPLRGCPVSHWGAGIRERPPGCGRKYRR